MRLKQFQDRAVARLREHLTFLAQCRDRYITKLHSADAIDVRIARQEHFGHQAWPQDLPGYTRAYTQDEQPVPDITIKVPTGGGKTLMACHALADIQRLFIQSHTGLVVWVVPSNQIYRQTVGALRDRTHPYRVALENSLGVPADRIKIMERNQPLLAQDVETKLVVLVLMLPAANRQLTQTLRMFKDASDFSSFFPRPNDHKETMKLLKTTSNLDTVGVSPDPVQIRTSLANVMRIKRPVLVVDEGHKAYSDGARETLMRFNPSFVLQLTATPREQANVLVEVTGQELDSEDMIKLPIHISPSPTVADWHTTLLRAKEERDKIEKDAVKFQRKSGRYIRPICLIQVERTGKDQHDPAYIHADQVRDYLMATCKVPADHIAIKSSERDDIEAVDLLSENCSIRYIITKFALQEGWDCPFAYILTILNNPSSLEGLTQLLGRILRQPHVQRTGVKRLDRCRVFAHRANSDALLHQIRTDLEKEGLGDMRGHVYSESPGTEEFRLTPPKLHSRYKRRPRHLYLPIFASKRDGDWVPIDYQSDILGCMNWSRVWRKGKAIGEQISLVHATRPSDYLKYIGSTPPQEIDAENANASAIDQVLLTQELTDVVMNAWHAWDMAGQIIEVLTTEHGEKMLEANFVHVIERARQLAAELVDEQCESVFRRQLANGNISFTLLAHPIADVLEGLKPVAKGREFLIHDRPPKKSLVRPYNAGEFTGLERDVAICLDAEAKLLWWHRNATRGGYRIQGWRRHRIFPDFVTSRIPPKDSNRGQVIVIETKGTHLDNKDTAYKQAVFDLCNEHTPVAETKTWQDLGKGFKEQVFLFNVVPQKEWQDTLNRLFK